MREVSICMTRAVCKQKLVCITIINAYNIRSSSAKRKTNRQTWCEINMTKAIEAVRKKEMGLKRASKQGAEDDRTASMQTERRC